MAGKLLESPAVQGLFELSSKILGYDMVGLCAQGPQERLPQCASPSLPQCASLTTMRSPRRRSSTRPSTRSRLGLGLELGLGLGLG